MGKIILSHPLGNPFCSHAASGLNKAGLLEQVSTAYCYKNNSGIGKLLSILPDIISSKILRQLERRSWLNVTDIKVTTFPRDEIIRMLLVKSNLNKLFGVSYQNLVDRVFINFDKNTANKIIPFSEAAAVYTYEDCALDTFIEAKKHGMKCIYDLPIMYYKESRKIESEEAALFPQFKYALYAAQDSAEKLIRKEKEISLADHIVVASTLTKNSLLANDFDQNRISVIPYGVPADGFFLSEKTKNKTFQVMFAGRIGPRKGIHYLIKAWEQAKLKDAQLYLIGINEFSKDYIKRLPENVKVINSLPSKELYNYYCNSDLFVLPSLVEGFGMVLLESMACGVPVLATTNTAAPDIIENGREGFIVPIRSAESLTEKLVWAYENRNELSEMGKAARKKAKELSWIKYENLLSNLVKRILS